jgi:hypothetical protein
MIAYILRSIYITSWSTYILSKHETGAHVMDFSENAIYQQCFIIIHLFKSRFFVYGIELHGKTYQKIMGYW